MLKTISLILKKGPKLNEHEIGYLIGISRGSGNNIAELALFRYQEDLARVATKEPHVSSVPTLPTAPNKTPKLMNYNYNSERGPQKFSKI